MEDSYTVHRRRKAAARKREKTPEPQRRRQDDVIGTDDDEDTRARMERMVQETERLEELEEKERRRIELEKSKENVEKTASVVEKPERVLKRAMSPEIRRRNEENQDDEKSDGKSFVEVTKREKSERLDDGETGTTGMKKSSSGVSPEVEEQPKDLPVESPRKARKSDGDDTTVVSRIVRRRRDVEKELSPESQEKPARGVKKPALTEVERIEKGRTDDEPSRTGERTREATRTRKTSSRDVDEVEQAVVSDENRREAVARESDAGPTKIVGGKNEAYVIQASLRIKKEDEYEDVERSRVRETSERTSKPVEEKVGARSREMVSPTKARNSESRVATTTTSKRTSKERNVERTGYTTDSSETEEIAKRVLRRKKSPEGTKTRSSSSKKITSRSRPTTDTDGDVEEHEQRKKVERRTASRRKPSSDSDDDLNFKNRTVSPSRQEKRDPGPRVPSRHGERTRSSEKRSGSRSRHSSDVNDDDPKIIRKSGSFPIETKVRDRSPSITRSTSEVKKQIIPLSDDSLIEDFERAQLDYMRKERGILDHDPMDDYVDPRMEAALRRRKFSVVQTEVEAEQVVQRVQQVEKKSWFSWLPFFGRGGKKDKLEDEKETKEIIEEEKPPVKIEKIQKEEELPVKKRVSFMEFFRTLADFMSEFRAFVEQNPRETRKIRLLRNRCIAELLLAIIYCGLGAFVFRFTEGAFETFYKCGVKRVKRDFLDSLWNFSHNMREEDWKSMARRKLMEFEEQLHTAHEAGVHSYSGQKSWSFLNAVVYCLTVITTIGYGHISPSTTTGRAITIVYAIFGIPMFLIILADFGKLFTRGIKFLWAFVRRVYYTGSCRRVRRTVPVQEVMKGVQLVYDLATFRRPSQMNPEEFEEMQKQQNQTQTVLNLDGTAPPSAQPGTPGTPALSNFAIDDEFNLPISVAIVILLAYIFVGATVYNFWEQWGFFESFYFVFISMSTIGFGDYVPKHPIYMMLSIVYLVFGLALTSMCINVVQVMLSDSFKQASQKIGATIGFEVAEEDASVDPAAGDQVEVADVHATIKESESEEQVAPKAKQEDMDL